jgi:hypothetical protein
MWYHGRLSAGSFGPRKKSTVSSRAIPLFPPLLSTAFFYPPKKIADDDLYVTTAKYRKQIVSQNPANFYDYSSSCITKIPFQNLVNH